MRSWQFLLSPSGRTKNADLNENGVPRTLCIILTSRLFLLLPGKNSKSLVRGTPNTPCKKHHTFFKRKDEIHL